jgi:hypothetical protein
MNRTRKAVVGGALAACTLLGGGIGAALLNGTANAQTSTSTTAAPSTAQPAPPSGQPPANFDPTKGGHVANGITEVLLTGDTADKVRAAALAAVPGGTIQRVENDAEGSPYEAHVTKADGTHVTVKVDSNFKVTSTEDGPR